MRCRFSFVVLFCIGLVTNATAQLLQQGNKLVGTGAVGNARQGTSVSISADGNTAIVGGEYDNSSAGAAWVFIRTSGVWIQQGNKLVGAGAVGPARQGGSVSISADGNTAIVGGAGDNSNAGAAWVFTRTGSSWSGGTKLVGTGAVGAAAQGSSVSISADGNTAIVGGPYDNGSAGAAWVFSRTGDVWSQQGSKLSGSGAVGTPYKGYSVSISADGNTAIIGGWNDNSAAGAVWVFTRTGGVWSQQGSKLVGTGAVGGAHQGNSVSLSSDGNTAMVGGNGDDNFTGAAWVFTRTGGTWTQQGSKLVGTGGLLMPQQGTSVSLSSDGSTALVGGWADDGMGATWVFTRAGGVWAQQGSKLRVTGAIGSTAEGSSVSLSADGKRAIIGGPFDNSSAGAVWMFINGQPAIASVDDLAFDQGGTAVVNWYKSLGDELPSNLVTQYWIWRGIRSTASSPQAIVLNRDEYTKRLSQHKLTDQTFMGMRARKDDPFAANDIFWQYISVIPSHGLSNYSYACPTLADSTPQGIPWRFFFITAATSNPNVFWDSRPDSGYSVDNLAPLTPGGALLTPLNNALRLQWDFNRTDPDVGHYIVYRSTTSGFPLADSTRFRTTADSTIVDSSTVAGRTYYYRITTADVHGNESLPTQELGDSPLPIQLASFTALPSPSGNGVLLDWITVSEVNNFGFEVQRSLDNESNYQTFPNSFVAGHGTTNELHHYTFIDSSAYPAHWFYRLRQIDLGGTVHFSNGISINTLTGVSQQGTLQRFALGQNYPDPFNPSTTITYQLPTASHVTLKIYNTMGQEVVTLVDGVQEAGYKSIVWDARLSGGLAARVASGIYFYRITASTGHDVFTEVKKMLVLR